VKNPYEVLDVEKTVSARELKKAYRNLAKKFHPDTSDIPDADERFKEISAAYSILSDPEKRKNFDKYGTPDPAPRGFHGSANPSNVSDFFRNFGGGFEDVFSGQTSRGKQAKKGADIRAQVMVTLEQASSGGEVSINYDPKRQCQPCSGKGTTSKDGSKICSSCHGAGNITHQQGFFAFVSDCPQCSGSGNILIDPCVSCSGKGVNQKHKTITVKIPAGVSDGSVVRLKGMGHETSVGYPGNLFLVVHVRKHDKFERIGNDIHTDLHVSVSQAMLGDIVKIETLSSGKKNLNVPPGTQHDTLLKLGKLGVNGGDHIVSIKVKIPEYLSPKEKDLIEKFQEIRSDQ